MIKILSSKDYEEKTKNYGDCIVFIENSTAIVYDCGSEEHAKRVVKLLDENNIEQADVVLSHNDDDHFKGIPYLINEGRVSKLFTILLLKYKKELLDEIDDERRNRNSIGDSIKDLYDNIATLSKKVKLCDVYADSEQMPNQMKLIGPSFDYMIKAASKGLDSREGDTIDKETIINAASVQIQLISNNGTFLLTGDCTPVAIPEDVNLKEFDYIQLPHHGKLSLSEEIFDRVGSKYDMVYLVSDNTGSSNGGSDDLVHKSKGHIIKNTKIDGDVEFSSKTSKSTIPIFTGRILGI